MKFLCIYKPGKPEGTPPSQEMMSKMGKLIEDGFKSGWLLATEGCLPSALGARVRRSGEKVTVTDGPFTESKEIIGGFALIRATSLRRLSLSHCLAISERIRRILRRISVDNDGRCVD